MCPCHAAAGGILPLFSLPLLPPRSMQMVLNRGVPQVLHTLVIDLVMGATYIVSACYLACLEVSLPVRCFRHPCNRAAWRRCLARSLNPCSAPSTLLSSLALIYQPLHFQSLRRPGICSARFRSDKRCYYTPPYITPFPPCMQSGALVYAQRVPERWFPGKFDLFFHSHQIFHVGWHPPCGLASGLACSGGDVLGEGEGGRGGSGEGECPGPAVFHAGLC